MAPTTNSLSLLDWAARSPGLTSRQDWLDWAAGRKSPDPSQTSPPPLPHIPAMHRRRLSAMGKAALWCSHEVLADTQRPHATIFCSQHGEVQHTVGLLKELAEGQGLSPAAFSLSVHNAIGGIHSIALKDTGNIIALSAGSDGHCAALLEAHALLLDNTDYGHVLCVLYDEPLPALYDAAGMAPDFPMAIALLVGRAGDPGAGQILDVELLSNTGTPPTPQPLQQFMRFLLDTDQKPIETATDLRLWRWQKRNPEA